MLNVRGKKIFVGLSGGVDSAVSAALLKEAGALVTGVFIKGWYPPGMPCGWAEERRDAMRVAARLHIPFRTLDASAEYKKSVIDYLISEYKDGRTPNPDVMCNREVKFGAFYRYAMENGADAIAMGHYRSGEKDQSYFLWAVPKEVLNATVFPIGNLEKSEVRKLAKKFNIPVAEKKDSQGICFLGAVSVKEFLEKELGNDNPALLHTIGQRASLPDGPWYVVGKDVENKKLTVSRSRKQPRRQKSGLRPEASEESVTEIKFRDSNWFNDSKQVTEAQYRYHGQSFGGEIKGSCFISSVSLPDIPALGQSIVFYSGDEMIGGGIITS